MTGVFDLSNVNAKLNGVPKMNRLTKLLAATAAGAALSLFAAASSQAAIFISFDGVTSLIPTMMGTEFQYTANCTVVANCGGFESITVRGDAPPRPGLLHSDAVEVNKKGTGSAAITIWVTRTGFVPLGKKQYQSYTTNNVGGAVDSTLSTLVSSSNALFAGTSIGSFHNNTNGSDNKNLTTYFDFSANHTYSVTHKYIIKAPSSPGSQRSASPTIGTSVPEPATWALMIAGFGGAGAMLRRRKAVAA